MKNRYFVILTFVLVFFSCERKIKGDADATDYDDLIYTDSFSPSSFESPLSRRVIRMEDVDIGLLLDNNTGNPTRRGLYSAIDSLFKTISEKGDLEECFSASAYNSFKLRYGEPLLESRYRLRVGLPDNENSNVLWMSFKLIVKGKSYQGKIQLTKIEERYIISDFEYQGFDELFLSSEEKDLL